MPKPDRKIDKPIINMGRNNFTRREIKEKSRYRLWVKFYPQFVSERLPIIKIYYSYEKAGFPEYGKHRLENLIKRNRHKMEIVILYDNLTGKEISRY